MARLLFALLNPLLRRDKVKIFRNIRAIYGLPAHSNFSKMFAKQVLCHQLAVGLETFRCLNRGSQDFTFEGLDELQNAVTRLHGQGRGLIITTAHIGSWEFVAQQVAKVSGRTFYALAKPSKLPSFTKYLDHLRAEMDTKVLWTDDRGLLKSMLQVLKAGSCLGFVMDQKPDHRIGPTVEFFGLPTEFVGGPAKVAMRTKSPILAVYCLRVGRCKYRLVSDVLLDPTINAETYTEQTLTQRMASSIEAIIRLYPEQWLWNYKRWRYDSLETLHARGPYERFESSSSTVS